MTGHTRRTSAALAVVPGAVALGLLALVWAATRGPASFVDSSGRRVVRHYDDPTATPFDNGGRADPLRELRGRPPAHDFSWIGDIVMWALVLFAATLLVAAVMWLWDHRPRPTPPPSDVEFDVLPQPGLLTAAVEQDAAAQVDALGQGTPRNGIVRCWLRLEQAVAAVGVPRGPAETSTELTVRVLHRLDIDPRPIGTLAALFREARFSDHELTEQARAAARAALRSIHEELRDVSTQAGRR